MKKILISLPLLLVVTGCNNQNPTPKPPKEEEYELTMTAALATDEPFEIKYSFPKKYCSFSHPGSEVKKELAIISFASVIHSSEKERVKDFYDEFGFSNFYQSPDYEVEETPDSILYTIAHKSLDDSELIAVNLNGVNYKAPWINNFKLDKEGNAAGFQIAADKVLNALYTYLEDYKESNLKFWITGYSRGAGIANLISYTLLENTTLNIPEDNMYCYTYEAPSVIETEGMKAHPSIYNIISSADVVTHMAPTKYGFSRAGVDHDISSNVKIDSVIKSFDKRIKIPSFTPVSGSYSNEVEFINYLIDLLSKDISSSNPDADMSTREHYVDNYQEHIGYLIYLVMNMKAETRTAIINAIKALIDSGDYTTLINFFTKDDVLYEFIYPILDEHSETYNKDKLKAAINQAVKLCSATGLPLLLVSENFRNNLMRTAYIHAPEVQLALLDNATF